MAVKDCPPVPAVATTIEVVPCPLMIIPADTIHLYVKLTDGLAMDTFALKLTVGSVTESGQEMVRTGQLWEYARSATFGTTSSESRRRCRISWMYYYDGILVKLFSRENLPLAGQSTIAIGVNYFCFDDFSCNSKRCSTEVKFLEYSYAFFLSSIEILRFMRETLFHSRLSCVMLPPDKLGCPETRLIKRGAEERDARYA